MKPLLQNLGICVLSTTAAWLGYSLSRAPEKAPETQQSQAPQRLSVTHQGTTEQASMAERFSVKQGLSSRKEMSPELKARLEALRTKYPTFIQNLAKQGERLQKIVEDIDKTPVSLREDSHPSVGGIRQVMHVLEISDAEKQFIDHKRKAWVRSTEDFFVASRNANEDLFKTSEGISLIEKAVLEKGDKQKKPLTEFLNQRRKAHYEGLSSEYDYAALNEVDRTADLLDHPVFNKLVLSRLSEASRKNYEEVTKNHKTAKHELEVVWKLNETTMAANLTDAQRQAAYEVYSKNPNAKPEKLKGILTDAQIKNLGK